jgi:putative Mg2+ transporter-C (MgtC) family protein
MNDSTLSFFGLTILLPAEGKQLLLAAAVGLIIGVDRALRGKAASLRTFSMIATGSCLFTILSVKANGPNTGFHDVTRIAAQIVTGVGFLGGGVIFKTADRVEGITTAAMIWLCSALGMACGFNQVTAVYWAFAVGVFVHFVSIWAHKVIDPFNRSKKRHVPASD